MKFLPIIFTLLILTVLTVITNAQIKWNVTNDTTKLTPTRFIGKGFVNVNNGKTGTMRVDGTIVVDMKESHIYFNDGKNIFQFEKDQLSDIKLEGYGSFTGAELFRKSFSDSFLQHYRRIIYPSLELNEIVFSLSKKARYELLDDGLVLKNQKKLIGKICYVDLDNISIVNKDGELEQLKDGDFNFLQVGILKTFSCKDLYNYLFRDFEKRLSENINKWEDDIKKDNIEGLIAFFGPFENIANISSEKKMITWKKIRPAYYFNLSTNSRTFSYTSNRYLTNLTSNGGSFFSRISPFFIYGNSYRSVDISQSGNSMNMATSQSNQSGSIIYKDEGSTFAIIQDSNNKIIQVYHENIFSDPQYGKPFRFISF